MLSFKIFYWGVVDLGTSQVALEVKNPSANAGDMRPRFDP